MHDKLGRWLQMKCCLTMLEYWSICQTTKLKMEEKASFLNSFRTRFSKVLFILT